MLLGGLWHGAAWNFVIWGGLHGLLLALHRPFARTGATGDEPLQWSDAGKIFVFFNVTCLLWIFFRAPEFSGAIAILGRLFSFDYGATWPVLQCLVIAFCVVLHGIERWLRVHAESIRGTLGGITGGVLEAAIMGTIVSLAVIFGGSGEEFIYFQF